ASRTRSDVFGDAHPSDLVEWRTKGEDSFAHSASRAKEGEKMEPAVEDAREWVKQIVNLSDGSDAPTIPLGPVSDGPVLVQERPPGPVPGSRFDGDIGRGRGNDPRSIPDWGGFDPDSDFQEEYDRRNFGAFFSRDYDIRPPQISSPPLPVPTAGLTE